MVLHELGHKKTLKAKSSSCGAICTLAYHSMHKQCAIGIASVQLTPHLELLQSLNKEINLVSFVDTHPYP